jgi:hypothetical protein
MNTPMQKYATRRRIVLILACMMGLPVALLGALGVAWIYDGFTRPPETVIGNPLADGAQALAIAGGLALAIVVGAAALLACLRPAQN